MRRRIMLLCGCLGAAALVAALAVVPLLQAPASAARPLDGLAPAGPLLVVESPDFTALVRDWDQSREKQLWLASGNFREFSRSRLYLRLQEAEQEFETAGGIPANMPLLRSVAGGDSLLALYDIGKLELLYITRMPAARAAETLLWQARSKFEPRNAAGTAYYVATDKSSGKTVAFAAADDLLVLGTREDLVAGALQLLAGRPAGGPAGAAPGAAPARTAVKDERWYAESLKAAAGQPGDLRLVLNLEALVRTPYFRSYWIQRNASEVKQFYAGVCDLRRFPNEIREERVLLRASADSPPAPRPGVEPLLALVPPDTGFYRAWSAPASDTVLDLIAQKVLAPRPEGYVPRTAAPNVALTGGEVGSEADLETLVDEPPAENAAAVFVPGPLGGIVRAVGVQGLLQLQSTARAPDGLFVRDASAVALLGASDWDGPAVRAALVTAVEGLWSRGRLGLKWNEKKRGTRTWYELDGLAPLAMTSDGRWLLVANDVAALGAALDRLKPAPSPSPGPIFAAGFRHAAGRKNYISMMQALDHVSAPRPEPVGDAGQAAPPPRFFSENIGSLSETLGRVESSAIERRDHGAALNEIVTYRLSK